CRLWQDCGSVRVRVQMNSRASRAERAPLASDIGGRIGDSIPGACSQPPQCLHLNTSDVFPGRKPVPSNSCCVLWPEALARSDQSSCPPAARAAVQNGGTLILLT